VHPPGIVEWGTTPKDFFEKKVGDDVDHHRQPDQRAQQRQVRLRRGHAAGRQARGSPTGGGNFYIFKKATPAQQEAAFKFAKWITQPERAASGASTPATWRCRRRPTTPALKKYVADFPPALVARDQLPFALAELSTHDNQRVTKALNDGLQAALTGTKTPAQAMKDAQREAERILRAYR
jgi:sn-glycerol 3-phosphate transport system substrate-binding protein